MKRPILKPLTSWILGIGVGESGIAGGGPGGKERLTLSVPEAKVHNLANVIPQISKFTAAPLIPSSNFRFLPKSDQSE